MVNLDRFRSLLLGWVKAWTIESSRLRGLRSSHVVLALLMWLMALWRFSWEVLSFYRVTELRVRDLSVSIYINSSNKSNQLIFKRVVSVFFEKNSQIVDVDLSFVLSVDGLEAPKSRKVMSLFKLKSQLLRRSQELYFPFELIPTKPYFKRRSESAVSIGKGKYSSLSTLWVSLWVTWQRR